jgi:hypothetical protein
MIIKDVEGQRYELKDGELREVDQEWDESYYVVLENFPERRGWVGGGLYGIIRSYSAARWVVSIKDRSIGCRVFDKENFAKILKAARAPHPDTPPKSRHQSGRP